MIPLKCACLFCQMLVTIFSRNSALRGSVIQEFLSRAPRPGTMCGRRTDQNGTEAKQCTVLDSTWIPQSQATLWQTCQEVSTTSDRGRLGARVEENKKCDFKVQTVNLSFLKFRHGRGKFVSLPSLGLMWI